jgi:hypothetical protein
MIPVRENNEVVIIYPDIHIFIYIYTYIVIYIPSIFLFIYIYNTTRKIDNIKIHYDPSFVAPDLCGATELLQCRLGLLDARVVHLARRHGGTFAMGEMAGFTMENPGKKTMIYKIINMF